MATALGYDTSVKNNLWQDRVNTEVNFAVLHSYNSAGVAIVDQHTLVILSFTYFLLFNIEPRPFFIFCQIFAIFDDF